MTRKCLKYCPSGTHRENNVCVENECSCEYGTPSTVCDYMEQKCESCNSGYSLNPNTYSCTQNSCLCNNGTPSFRCAADGLHHCEICEDGFGLIEYTGCHSKYASTKILNMIDRCLISSDFLYGLDTYKNYV